MEMRPIASIAPSTQQLGERPNLPATPPLSLAPPPAAPVDTAMAVQQTAKTASPEQLGEAIKSINKTMQQLSQNIEFSVDTDSRRTVVKVIDQQTGDVIRQMPSEEALEISKALDRIQGLLLKQKA